MEEVCKINEAKNKAVLAVRCALDFEHLVPLIGKDKAFKTIGVNYHLKKDAVLKITRLGFKLLKAHPEEAAKLRNSEKNLMEKA